MDTTPFWLKVLGVEKVWVEKRLSKINELNRILNALRIEKNNPTTNWSIIVGDNEKDILIHKASIVKNYLEQGKITIEKLTIKDIDSHYRQVATGLSMILGSKRYQSEIKQRKERKQMSNNYVTKEELQESLNEMVKKIVQMVKATELDKPVKLRTKGNKKNKKEPHQPKYYSFQKTADGRFRGTFETKRDTTIYLRTKYETREEALRDADLCSRMWGLNQDKNQEETLNEFSDLPIDDRLRLAIEVCDAFCSRKPRKMKNKK